MGDETLAQALVAAWRQALQEGRSEVEVAGSRVRVERSHKLGLKVVVFSWGGVPIEGIEQNPQTRSRWAAMAQEGRRILQFRCRGRYIGNVCDGVLTRYPAWKALGLPE
jgi:hypothetical protein